MSDIDRIEVDVTQEIINAGICKHRLGCAAAMAIFRALERAGWNPMFVAVDYATGPILICTERSVAKSMRVPVPSWLAAWISLFDNNKRSATPIRFLIDMKHQAVLRPEDIA